MESKLDLLKEKLKEVSDIKAAGALMYWDQTTYMPPGAAEARARQNATLSKLAHEKFIDPEIGKLLEELKSLEASLTYESDEASLIRITCRAYERKTKIPANFMNKFSAHTAKSYEMWVRAKQNDNFDMVAPYLEKTIDLSRELANFFPGYKHIADPLIDAHDYGMKASVIKEIFANLRKELVAIVDKISTQEPIDSSCICQRFDTEKQLNFAKEVVKIFGFDMNRGRIDISPHPYAINFSIDDVRFNTRIKEDDLSEVLFSTFHESGHAMYEQGINKEYEATPLAGGTSSGVHESQSRLWENIVGRSLSFWKYFYPQLQEVFPSQLKSVSLNNFYRAINKVVPSLIRTDADEVTYNLHVMLRFDLELQLLEGSLSVRDLPDAWNARYEADLGVTPPNYQQGVLQDMHWFYGMVGGAFQGYTLGNIMNAQFYEAALKSHPEIPADMENGQFDKLFSWLKENIWHHGSKFTPNEIIKRVTGKDLDTDAYIRYLKGKYGKIYEL